MRLTDYFRSRKGTDKPIEIFVALFIILAVAMVVLQMFSGQISAKAKELKSMEQSTALKREIGEAKQMCQEKCTNALENDCSDAMRAQFCITYINEGLDLNGNGITSDYDYDFLGGVGICEDRIYCPHIVNCICKQELSMHNCLQILCSYWLKQGISQADVDQALTKYVRPGTCNYTTKRQHWANLEAISCTGGPAAPNCWNQGYNCCSSCQSGAQSQYDSTCGQGQVCCAACTQPATCQSQGGQCCDSCQSGAMPQYNSDCGTQLCCATCNTQGGCSNDCTSGAKECVTSGSYRTCGNYDADSCTEWSTAANCLSGETCSNGVCATSCSNECTTGAKECVSLGSFRTCGNYDADSCTEWSSATNCPSGETCASGTCSAAATYTITIVPSSATISRNSQFTVNINANSISNLAGAELTLNFDSTRMQYVSNAPGGFLDNCPVVQPSGSTVQIACVKLSGSGSGTGTITTVTFTATNSGQAGFSLSNIQLGDPLGATIAATAGTASITIT